jgi:hypothetical protein
MRYPLNNRYTYSMFPSKNQSLSPQRLSERPGRLGMHIMDADASGRLIVLEVSPGRVSHGLALIRTALSDQIRTGMMA